MADRCTGTTVSGNRCRNGPNCHIHKDPCSICLSRITNDNKRVLHCGHEFHSGCIDRLKETGSNRCPLCRKLFDVSHFKISLKIVNTRTDVVSDTELPSEILRNIIDGLDIDFLDFSRYLTELNFDIDTLQDLESLLNDIGVGNTDINPAVLNTE